MTMPVLGASQLSATLMVIVAEPLPDPPLAIDIQPASGATVHGHAASVTMLVVTCDAAMQGDSSTGDTRYSHSAVSPLCEMVKVRAATEIEPLRPPMSVFLSTM